MKKALIAIMFLVLLILPFVSADVISSGTRAVVINNKSDEKIYDWVIELILCKECSPYKTESISQTELSRAKDEIISSFENGKIIFERFGENRIFINATDEVKNILQRGINITGITISTMYMTMLIDQTKQKEPLKEEEIYKCEKDRECMIVQKECCECPSAGISINKNYYNYWNNKRSGNCEGIACAAVACVMDVIPKCTKGVCKVISIQCGDGICQDFEINKDYSIYYCPEDCKENITCKSDSDCPQSNCENGVCYKNLSNGRKAEIKIMPETASERAIERLGELNFTIQLKEVGKGDDIKAAYELKAEKKVKLFGLFNKKALIQAQVDAETGNIIKIKKPWWSFLASGF